MEYPFMCRQWIFFIDHLQKIIRRCRCSRMGKPLIGLALDEDINYGGLLFPIRENIPYVYFPMMSITSE
jgi:hypothetical protein